jgi:hypothetical protein
MSEVEVPEARDPFERLIALSVAILAVVLAFVDNTGNNGQADAIVKTNLASNQWAYYQAKSLKENLSANNAELLAALAPNDSSKAKVEELKKQAERYEAEKKEIKEKAEALTKEAEHGQAIDDQCDIAALLLQIAVVICSIAILVRWKAIYFVGLAVGVAGVYEGIVAFLM